MSLVEGIRSHYRLFGGMGILLATKSRLLRRQILVEAVAPGISHPIRLRLRTSDTSLLEEIILNREYDFEPPDPPRTIIDGGANIGLTSVFLANRFPAARIIAVEPDPDNFALLRHNVAPYANVTPVQAALWGRSMPLTLVDGGCGSWGFQTCEVEGKSAGDEVQGITVDELMERFRWDYVDVLKIDIEGAEKEVFAAASSWIDHVGVIIVELHDRIKHGCSDTVFAATKAFACRAQRGETIFLFKSPPSECDPRALDVHRLDHPVVRGGPPFRIKPSESSTC